MNTLVEGFKKNQSSNCQGIKKSRQDFRLYGSQLPERIAIFGFQTASGGIGKATRHAIRSRTAVARASPEHRASPAKHSS